MLRRRDILVAVALVATMGVLGCGSEEKASGPVTPLVDTVPPAAVMELAATVNASVNATITLDWRPGAELDLAGYRIYRVSMDLEGRPVKREENEIKSDWLSTVTYHHFTDLTVVPGKRYVYSVTAFDAAGNESPRVTTAPLEVSGRGRTPDVEIAG
jgi:hypothetical protein